MAKSRKSILENRRPLAEYLLIAIMGVLFLFGLWAYRQSSEPTESADTDTPVYVSGTPDEVDALAEQANRAELKAEAAFDDEETTTSSALEGAADNVGGAYDETVF